MSSCMFARSRHAKLRIDIDTSMQVLCLFDSVKRIKTRWKCQFKDVVMNVHGQDLIFTSAAADFTFQ